MWWPYRNLWTYMKNHENRHQKKQNKMLISMRDPHSKFFQSKIHKFFKNGWHYVFPQFCWCSTLFVHLFFFNLYNYINWSKTICSSFDQNIIKDSVVHFASRFFLFQKHFNLYWKNNFCWNSLWFLKSRYINSFCQQFRSIGKY